MQGSIFFLFCCFLLSLCCFCSFGTPCLTYFLDRKLWDYVYSVCSLYWCDLVYHNYSISFLYAQCDSCQVEIAVYNWQYEDFGTWVHRLWRWVLGSMIRGWMSVTRGVSGIIGRLFWSENHTLEECMQHRYSSAKELGLLIKTNRDLSSGDNRIKIVSTSFDSN